MTFNQRPAHHEVLTGDAGIHGQGYQLSQVWRLASGHKIRVRIRRDSYILQSHATVEVLSYHLTWTNLADLATSLWWDGTRSPHDLTSEAVIREELDQLVMDLVGMAAAILA